VFEGVVFWVEVVGSMVVRKTKSMALVAVVGSGTGFYLVRSMSWDERAPRGKRV